MTTGPASRPPELGRNRQQYVDWVDLLAPTDSPTWLGFGPNAERLLSSRQGLESINKWCALYTRSKEELHELLPLVGDTGDEISSSNLSGQRSMGPGKMISRAGSVLATSWLVELTPQIDSLLKMLPKSAPLLERTDTSVRDPMFRCFERESSVASK